VTKVWILLPPQESAKCADRPYRFFRTSAARFREPTPEGWPGEGEERSLVFVDRVSATLYGYIVWIGGKGYLGKPARSQSRPKMDAFMPGCQNIIGIISYSLIKN
jgi:hypothetical protein